MMIGAALICVFWFGYYVGRSDEKLAAMEADAFRRLDAVISQVCDEPKAAS